MILRRLALTSALLLSGFCLSAATPDLTEKLENLGVPLSSRYGGGNSIYARNVWSMIAYKGKIYLGAGNSSNGGPAANAGSVPVVAFDPATKTCQTEWSVPDEQIDVFRVFSDGLLYIPGHDPKESWKLGNFYRRKEDGSWEKVRTMPDGVHNYDMAEFDGKLFAAGYGVAVSPNRGRTMKLLSVSGGRVHALLVYKDRMFAVAEPLFSTKNRKKGSVDPNALNGNGKGISVYDKHKESFSTTGMNARDLFPKTTPEDGYFAGKIMHHTPFKKQILYIGGYPHNDHQTKPFGAYSSTAAGSRIRARKIDLPKDAVPWDFEAVNNTKIYLLYSIQEGRDTVNYVAESADGTIFKPIFSFKASTFARSFAYLDGFFYFGMGTEIQDSGFFKGNKLQLNWSPDELNPECGTLYRIPWK